MTKFILLIIGTILLYITIDHCQARKDTDSTENQTKIIPSKSKKSFVQHRRVRRQYQDSNVDTAQAVLSILPLDRLGTIVGQIMSTGLKEMLNPDVGKKIVNVLENQAPLLLTSLFTNLFSTLRDPGRPSTPTLSSVSINNNPMKQLSNSSTSDLINSIRRPTKK